MRTLKISIVATVAAMLAWWFRFPHRIWPAHPQFADFLLALILGLVLQFTWADAKSKPESKAKKKNGDLGQSPQKL